MTETMAEKAVQTAKRIVMTASTSGRDPYVEIYSTFDTGLVTTDPREPRGYSAALRREASETEVEEKQDKQKLKRNTRNRRRSTTELVPVSQSETRC